MLLVTITISMYWGMLGLTYETNWTYQDMETIEECQAKKHQLEYLPPPGINNAQVYFCWGK